MAEKQRERENTCLPQFFFNLRDVNVFILGRNFSE